MFTEKSVTSVTSGGGELIGAVPPVPAVVLDGLLSKPALSSATLSSLGVQAEKPQVPGWALQAPSSWLVGQVEL